MSSISPPPMFDCLLGLQCNDFTMVCADQTSCNKSIFIVKNDLDKLVQLSDKLVMGIMGDLGDVMQFSHFINNNFLLYKMKNGYQLSTSAAVHFTRKTLADTYKTNNPYMLNLLLGGWDEQEGGQLFTMDFTATSVRVPYAAHGFAGFLGISVLEHFYRPEMTEAEAYEVFQICVREIHERVFLNLPRFIVKVVSKEGISTLPIINPPSRVL